MESQGVLTSIAKELSRRSTLEQLDSIVICERVTSAISLVSCLAIIATFIFDSTFRKHINRLIFYASFGNIMTNVATLMGRSGIHNPNSFECQFQGVLIQWFMPADSYWTLAMAYNVYLTFYRNGSSETLRKMEKWYFTFCYGLPGIPALVFVAVKTKANGRFYGDATLWCWISSEWDIFRFITFYGPVWLATFGNIFIYCRCGGEIYQKQKQLKGLQSPKDIVIFDPWDNVKITEVHVTSEKIEHEGPNGTFYESGSSDLQLEHEKSEVPGAPGSYSVSVSTQQRLHRQNDPSEMQRPKTADTHDGSQDITSFGSQTSGRKSLRTAPRQQATINANSAAVGYAKVAALIFIAMLVTWIPSSANRLYSIVHSGKTSVALEFISATVLPLQGFWNALIYFYTSRFQTRELYRHILFYLSRKSHPSPISDISTYDRSPFARTRSRMSRQTRRRDGYEEDDDMTELSNMRRTQSDSKV
ncbi:G-protein coupled receptor 1-like protein 1 [Phlyctema vagabunda]|uniref:G-protein coupled receptor 1-like protein 1 n=1 Tax=Phlyctema vagabunda TaxID=108571 RepID=A0ABR4PPC6_9HELO